MAIKSSFSLCKLMLMKNIFRKLINNRLFTQVKVDQPTISIICFIYDHLIALIKFRFHFYVSLLADDVWKIHRKSLNYSFNLKILQTFIPIFIENAQKLVDDLSVNVGKTKEFDMLSYTTKSALNMICGELTTGDLISSSRLLRKANFLM